MDSSIQVLPQEVVDRIAAGEVVQRPVSVVKELLENSLDAGSTDIVVSVENGGLVKLVITDNGCGIRKDDLKLAAVRHATSKLRTVQDFSKLSSFGFRGEALASVSMVSRLSIITRTADSQVGYSQSYRNGSPIQPNPKPTARQKGTTVTVQDLFYNLPHRKKLRAAEEYNKILTVVQQYSILYAGQGISIVCQKTGKKNNITDLNTGTSVAALKTAIEAKDKPESMQQLRLQSTKQVISQVFGSQVAPYLQEFKCEKNEANENAFSYTCNGLITSSSHTSLKRTQLVLFMNSRLVECNVLKRELEDAYLEFTKAKPFLFLSISVPPATVDVNVHPTKKEVALLHLEEICKHLCSHLRQELAKAGQSFQQRGVSDDNKKSKSAVNPYKRKQPASSSQNEEQRAKKVAPSKLIRTSRSSQSGALEPFLVSTQTQTMTQSQSQSTNTAVSPELKSSTTPHKDDCPLASHDLDLSQPGAFATAAARCTCIETVKEDTVIRLPRQALTRPKKVIPTVCNYASIAALRKRISKRADSALERQLRNACFVGVVSHQRSLIQAGEELILMNHYEAAREMFYQLALNRFAGGAAMAKLGDGGCGGVDVQTVIAQAVQLEDTLQMEGGAEELATATERLPVNETNDVLAKQASTCLLDNAEMLEEYFGIAIEKDDEGRIMLTGLPVLLDGYAPEPHGLPVFLLRLATEVDWSEERPCFHGVCRELGAYYAQLPSDDLSAHVRHTLFPAISTLLVPSERLKNEGGFTLMTKLSKLYRVFERC